MEMQNQKRGRSAGIELFRVVLMFGICLLHSIGQNGCPGSWLTYLLRPCVVAFVFISGWFGICFRPSKYIRLYCVGIFCCIVNVAITVAYFGDDPRLESGFWQGVLWMWTKSFWFLHAYAVLMLLAPFVNTALETLVNVNDRRRMVAVLLPALFLVFVWAGLTATPLIRRVIPQSPGVTDYSGFTFIGIYIAGRMFRFLDLENYVRGKYTLIAILSLMVLVGPVKLGNYASPFALALAAILFCWFKNLRIPAVLERVVVWLAPSMFSIYLLHGHKYGNVWLHELNYGRFSHGGGVVVTALIVFATCLTIDVVRRVAYVVVKSRAVKLCQQIDASYDRLIDRISERIR